MVDTHSTASRPHSAEGVFWAEQLAGQPFPPFIVDGLIGYLAYGLTPGSFVLAVLSNDLSEAVTRADDASFAALPKIVRWLHAHVDPGAWGSSTQVIAWMTARRAEQKVRAS